MPGEELRRKDAKVFASFLSFSRSFACFAGSPFRPPVSRSPAAPYAAAPGAASRGESALARPRTKGKKTNPPMNFRAVLNLLKETYAEFSRDNAMRLAAALAYYTIFSIAPLLVICISIAGLVFTQQGASEQISAQVKGLVGEAGATAIQSMVESAMQPKKSIVALIVGGATLLLGASGAFSELQSSLNTAWGVKTPENSGFWMMIKNRFLSFSMVLGTGFLLLVSLVLSAGIAMLSELFGKFMPGVEAIAHVVNIVVSLGVISALLAMIFKYLPDAEIRWSDVWVGAVVTAILFTIGKAALGLYLGNSAIGSSYGAAGSFVVVLVWVYYSSMILLFGAEFTEVYSRRRRGGSAKQRPEGAPAAASAGRRKEEGLSQANRERSEAFLERGRH